MPKIFGRLTVLEVILALLALLFISMIAFPGLTKSKATLNDATAPRLLLKLHRAQSVYAEMYNTGYSSNLASLGPPSNWVPSASAAGLVDSVLASGEDAGYIFIYSAGRPDANGNITTYAVNANPVTPGKTGKSFYYIDQTGVIRSNPSRPASASDPPVGG